MYKKIILSLIIAIFFPSISFAKGSWALMKEGSLVSLQGTCSEQIKLELFANENDENSAYQANVKCENGSFYFSKDFAKTDLTEGTYLVAVDGEKSQDTVAITKKAEKQLKQKDSEQTEISKQKEDSGEIKFLSAFVSLQQSILDMHKWLDSTSYSKILKKSIGAILDGLDLVAGKLSKAVLSGEISEDNQSPQADKKNNQEQKEDVVVSQVPAEEISELQNFSQEKAFDPMVSLSDAAAGQDQNLAIGKGESIPK